jgi:hypothetical protein
MASGFYTKAKQALLAGDIDLDADTVKVVLIDDGAYTADFDAHEFLDDVTAGTVGTAQTLGSKTVTGGVFDAADVTFSAVTGSSVESALYYIDTGDPATSRLLCVCALNSPVTPNGGDISLAHDNGANKIFKLA